MRRERRTRVLPRLALLALTPISTLLVASAVGSPDPRPTVPDRQIEIHAAATDESLNNKALGALTLRTALVLNSPDEAFGGWSGLTVDPNGDLLALSDRAHLLRGRFVMDENQVPIGIADGVIGVLRDEGGDNVPRLRSDSEGIALLPDGRYVVSFENPARVGFYNFAAEGSRAPLMLGPPLSKTPKLGLHYQLEAVAVLNRDSILVGSERGFNNDDHAVLWRVPIAFKPGERAIEPWTTLKLPRGLSLTDLAAAPDGSVFALFRQFIPFVGARAQIWRYVFLEEGGKTRAEGRMLASLEAPFPVDNYEGMAVTAKRDGGLRLYVISDNNYRARQRTILLAFDLNEKAPETGASSKSK